MSYLVFPASSMYVQLNMPSLSYLRTGSGTDLQLNDQVGSLGDQQLPLHAGLLEAT